MKRLNSSSTMSCKVAFRYSSELATTMEGLQARWDMQVIANEVQQSVDCDSSMFRAEFTTDDGYCQEKFASTFLRLVAGALS